MTSHASRTNGGVGGGGGKGERGLGRGGSVTGRGAARAGRRRDGARRLCRYLGAGAAQRGRRRRVRVGVCGRVWGSPSSPPPLHRVLSLRDVRRRGPSWAVLFLRAVRLRRGERDVRSGLTAGRAGSGGRTDGSLAPLGSRADRQPCPAAVSPLVQPPLAGAGGAARP